MRPKQAICTVRCASQKSPLAMRCTFTAICALAVEIHCDVGHDASIIASALPRCGELILLKGLSLSKYSLQWFRVCGTV